MISMVYAKNAGADPEQTRSSAGAGRSRRGQCRFIRCARQVGTARGVRDARDVRDTRDARDVRVRDE